MTTRKRTTKKTTAATAAAAPTTPPVETPVVRKKGIQPKVAAAGIGGAVTTLIIWGANAAGVDVPAEVAAALATIIAFGAGYLKTSN